MCPLIPYRLAYSFLNPHTQHGKLAGWIIGIGAAIVIIFAIARTVCVIRERLVRRSYLFGGRREGNSIHSEQIDDWETIERPGSGSRPPSRQA